MRAMDVAEQGRSASLAEALTLFAQEMQIAGDSCARLDGALAELLSAASGEQRFRVMQEMHVVDRLSQQLAALSGIARRLGGDVDPAVQVDLTAALSQVTLGEIVQRFRGRDSLAPDEDGDLDLF